MEFNSREDAVTLVAEDEQRVQYDEGDLDRIKSIAGTFTHHAVELIESLGQYADETQADADEDSESRMAYARRDLIEKWATTQLALSKIAWALRANGDEAYNRLLSALSVEDGNIDMRGL
jgi:hypothetical protein